MGVVWKEECTQEQREVIERIFESEQRAGNKPPRVLYRREVSGPRRQREPNARAELLAVVVCEGTWNGSRKAHLVTPQGQFFLYALSDADLAEIEELER